MYGDAPRGVGVQLHGGAGGGGGSSAEAPRYGGRRGHRLMVPPPGYKFIPRTEHICGEMGCFECYDIYCERCESKDRRIIELEMRNNELVKHITLLQGRLFPRGGDGQGQGAGGASGPPGAGGGEPFAYVQSPVMFDPGLGIQYQATTTFQAASPKGGGGGSGGR
eukprot:gnl/TRDRNA2_/TRDRNA2_38424_c0_seq1.p1 gnl/TRDRNA2_/TRDRNA2_38424_c0~~gnl/TRDRNA2_/TRDRNA2_38424_c0_seq1.p1  ORF type:complete len:165 (+),score=28.32 gnl/TRDRNA2_/TRDRNA2_38424_c0_seq1:51-545(+)